MTFAFDATAASFERHRALPSHVPEAIRSAIWTATALPTPARVLDIGAGTGRIGRAFVEAGDFYAGVDTSLAMLREFPASPNSNPGLLALADGRQLPFRDGGFDVVLLMQLLSGAGDWRGILGEARRVLRPGGSVVVGHTISPESGIDAQMKSRLTAILEEMQVAWHRPRESRRQALAWLESSAKRHGHALAASWSVNTTAREFLERHRTGARFAALPVEVQERALRKLRAWAEDTFGAVDVNFQEKRSFELDIFEF
jgi:ubiquinone/menaquinone biosynthesis C-methylase UbiE